MVRSREHRVHSVLWHTGFPSDVWGFNVAVSGRHSGPGAVVGVISPGLSDLHVVMPRCNDHHAATTIDDHARSSFTVAAATRGTVGAAHRGLIRSERSQLDGWGGARVLLDMSAACWVLLRLCSALPAACRVAPDAVHSVAVRDCCPAHTGFGHSLPDNPALAGGRTEAHEAVRLSHNRLASQRLVARLSGGPAGGGQGTCGGDRFASAARGSAGIDHGRLPLRPARESSTGGGYSPRGGGFAHRTSGHAVCAPVDGG